MANEINRIGINTGTVNNYGNPPKGENKPEDTVVETPAQGAPARRRRDLRRRRAAAQRGFSEGLLQYRQIER